MRTVIYSRVSTDKQETLGQLSKLKELYPNAEVFEETASGAKDRPLLVALVDTLVKGDTLVVAALDRLGRRASEILVLIEGMEARGVVLKSVREGIDYSTIMGRMVTQIMCSFAEMERRLISERTKSALQAKKAAGVILGRRVTVTRDMQLAMRDMYMSGRTQDEVAECFKVSQFSVSRALKNTMTPSMELKSKPKRNRKKRQRFNYFSEHKYDDTTTDKLKTELASLNKVPVKKTG